MYRLLMLGYIKYKAFSVIFVGLCVTPISAYVYAENLISVVEGYIYDCSTQEAMVDANIYLSQTTFGDVSDKKGYFRIENLPSGSYQLIISYVGYGIYNERVRIGSGEELFIEICLKPKEKFLDEVVVQAKRDRNWETNLRRFEKFFLGETKNGKLTKIQNSEVLSFESDLSILSASAEKELLIINSALGYEIKVDLTYFEWNYLNDTGSTLYFYSFKELEPNNATEQKSWKKNRETTYKYSQERFLKTLIFKENRDQYTLSGGSIKPIRRNEERERQLFSNSEPIYRFKIDIDGLNKNVTVEIDDWRVDKDTKIRYISYNETRDSIEKVMYIDINGSLQNQLDFTFDGVWYDHRLADKLPLNYRE